MGYVVLLVALALALLPAPASAGTRIVGGSAAGSYPAQAEVNIRKAGRNYLCGGTLVHAEWVLTAAHCVSRGSVTPRRVAVRLGSTTLGRGTRHAVDAIVRAPGWDPNRFREDAALLHLRRAAAEIPLPVAPPASVAPLGRVLGWGTTREGGQPSPQLRQVDVPIAPDPICASLYGGAFDAGSMLCAGYAQGGKDACQGDSGGPIMIDLDLGTAERWALAGIVSTGRGCAEAGQLGLYTDLGNTELQSWIAAKAVHRTVTRRKRRRS